MVDEKHMYLVVGGRYSSAGDSAERWQIGVRLALVFGTVDNVGTLPNNWGVAARNDSDTDSGWTYTSLWDGDGPLTSTFDTESYMKDYAVPSAIALIHSPAVSSLALLDTVKLSPINTSGHVIDQRTALATNATGVAGTQGGGLLPLQNSTVVSTQTQRTGSKGRGRFYLPAMSPNQLSSDGSLASGSVTDALAAGQAFLEGLAYSDSSPSQAHVAPIVTGGSYVDYGRIVSINVGNRVDTQRRRRAQLVETRVKQDLSFG